MAQEAKSGSISGRDTSFDVPESSCLLSGPGLQLDSRYHGYTTHGVADAHSILHWFPIPILVTSPIIYFEKSTRSIIQAATVKPTPQFVHAFSNAMSSETLISLGHTYRQQFAF